MARRLNDPIQPLPLYRASGSPCNHRCKSAPLFSTASRMLPPQPLSLQAFASLSGPLSTFFNYYLNCPLLHPLLADLLCTLPSLYFQQLTAIKFSNHLVVLKTMRIAGGKGREVPVAFVFSANYAWPALVGVLSALRKPTPLPLRTTRRCNPRPEFQVSHFEVRLSVSEARC